MIGYVHLGFCRSINEVLFVFLTRPASITPALLLLNKSYRIERRKRDGPCCIIRGLAHPNQAETTLAQFVTWYSTTASPISAKSSRPEGTSTPVPITANAKVTQFYLACSVIPILNRPSCQAATPILGMELKGRAASVQARSCARVAGSGNQYPALPGIGGREWLFSHLGGRWLWQNVFVVLRLNDALLVASMTTLGSS